MCIDSDAIIITGGSLFTALAVICWISGRRKHNPTVHLNNHAIFLFVDLMCVWLWGAFWGDLCWSGWERDDGVFDIPIYQFLIGSATSILFTNILVDNPRGQAVLVFIHVIVKLLFNIFLLMSVMAYHNHARTFWYWMAIVMGVVGYFHVLKESHVAYQGRPRLIRYLVILLGCFEFFYVMLITWSPLHQHLISTMNVELGIILVSVIITFICSFIIIQYGRVIKSNTQPSIFKPNYITHLLNGKSPQDIISIRNSMHTWQ
jgi:hypothetical protein